MHHRQVLRCHTHHAGGFCHRAAHAGIGIDVRRIHHRQVAQVLHATYQVHITYIRHDIGGGGLQGAHGGTAEAVDGLARDTVGQFGIQHYHACQVHTLLAALDD